MIGQDKFDISDDESDTTLDNSSDRSSNESYSSMPAQEEGQPGSLHLLLNMLDWQLDLGNLVRSMTLDWVSYSITHEVSAMKEQAIF